jgi:hypothetical protein
MQRFRLRLSVRWVMIAVAVVAVSLGGVRAWRRRVYCYGWSAVWALNEMSMRREAEIARRAHNNERVVSCEIEAESFSRLRLKYERTANRFWEPVPKDGTVPPELR